MGEEAEDIDQFLYGDEANFIQQMSANEAETTMGVDERPTKEREETEMAAAEKEDGEEEEESEEEEEELEIVLDGSSGPAKRGLTQVSISSDVAKTGAAGNALGTSAKASVDVDAAGVLNGEVIYNIELDSLPEKPWRMPGADITDYFNYGFTEQTWREYCLKQRTIRDELGTQKKIAVFDGSVPLVPGLPVPPFAPPPPGATGRPPVLPPGMPPFPFPVPPGGALPFPPFLFPGMPPPPGAPPGAIKTDPPASITAGKPADRDDEAESRERDKDRDRSEREYRSSRRDRRSPTRHRSRSRSKERDTKRRR